MIALGYHFLQPGVNGFWRCFGVVATSLQFKNFEGLGSIRSTVRMTGVAKNTVTKLLVELGAACAKYLDATPINLISRRIQCDEIWQYAGAKAKNVPAERRDVLGIGDVRTWVGIDADTN